MSDSLVTGIVTIVLGIIGVATLAVIVAPNARTSHVISSAGSALSQSIATAVSPVTGGGAGYISPTFGMGMTL